jgi:hypothetical protein
MQKGLKELQILKVRDIASIGELLGAGDCGGAQRNGSKAVGP